MKNIFSILLIASCLSVSAQTASNGHSHKDYLNRVPFWTAYNAHFGSIGIDLVAVDGKLYVATSKRDAKPDRTFDALYLEPMILRFEQNRNITWPDSDEKLQLVIDLNTPAIPTLDLLVAKLSQYPEVFDRSVNPLAIQVVVVANEPVPADFGKYPSFIMFNGRLSQTYSTEQLDRIGLYSATWNVGKSVANDRPKVEETIKTVHGLGKKIRFRSSVDTPDMWKILIEMGVDYVNTDKISGFSQFVAGQ